PSQSEIVSVTIHSGGAMSDEDKKVDQMPESETDAAGLAVTRRQFLIGAGTGLVVGAAGAAIGINLTAPKAAPQQATNTAPVAPTTAAPAQPGQPAQPAQPAAAVNAAVDGPRLVALNVTGRDYTV